MGWRGKSTLQLFHEIIATKYMNIFSALREKGRRRGAERAHNNIYIYFPLAFKDLLK